MKQQVINKYNEVLMVMGNTNNQTTMGAYPSVQKALDGMSKFFETTTWCETIEPVRIYGVVTEDNGYKHSTKEPLFTSSTSEFWGCKKPEIEEIRK